MNYTPLNFLYLFIYISTGSAFSLLVKRSSQLHGGSPPYEPVAITMTVEFFKLSATLFIIFFLQNREIPAKQKILYLLSKWQLAKQFAIPAALYCVFNTLAFYNLRLVSPATYRLLINLKVLWSGLMLQWICQENLTRRQWAGLVLLVTACGVEQWDSFDMHTGVLSIILIAAQAWCSSFAGVYFQLLLKKKNKEKQDTQLTAPSSEATNNSSASASASAPSPAAPTAELGLWEKNFFMYSWSIFFNIFYLFIFKNDVMMHPVAALSTFDANVVPIILCSGIGGFSTALILRDMDVIIKEYAGFAEMCVVVLGTRFIIGTPLKSTLFLAIVMVTFSLYLYNVPADYKAPSPSPNSKEEIPLQRLDKPDIEAPENEEDRQNK